MMYYDVLVFVIVDQYIMKIDTLAHTLPGLLHQVNLAGQNMAGDRN